MVVSLFIYACFGYYFYKIHTTLYKASEDFNYEWNSVNSYIHNAVVMIELGTSIMWAVALFTSTCF